MKISFSYDGMSFFMVVVVVNFNNPVPFFSDSSSVLLLFFCTIATIKGTGLIKKKKKNSGLL